MEGSFAEAQTKGRNLPCLPCPNDQSNRSGRASRPARRMSLAPRTFYNDRAGDGAIRRLARQVKRIDRLVRVAKADIEGRPPRQDDFPEGPWLLDRAEELKVKDSEPKPIVLGRHLVDRGFEPGPSFGPILEQCFEPSLTGRSRRNNGLALGQSARAKQLIIGPPENY